MYSLKQLSEIRADIGAFSLSAPDEMLRAEISDMQSICNGIGCNHPEHMPSPIRKVLNRVMRFAKCSAAIHDWRYANSDGTEEGRLVADKEFRANMLDEIACRKGHFKWLKEWIALRAFKAVRRCGMSDWCIAFVARQTKKHSDE